MRKTYFSLFLSFSLFFLTLDLDQEKLTEVNRADFVGRGDRSGTGPIPSEQDRVGGWRGAGGADSS
jgi:hypothetical protein